MSRKITYKERIEQIDNLIPHYQSVTDFARANQALYKWALKNHVDLKKYFPRNNISKLSDRENKGIDCYYYHSKQFYKHYAFVIEALRDLNLTYYYVKKNLKGEIAHIDGFYFITCS